MNYKYTPALHKIRLMKGRIKVIPGGSSAGKTIAILMILIDKCIRTPNLSVSIVSESTPHLRRGVIRDMLNILKDTGRYRDSQYNRTNLIYEFTNKSYIEFFSVDDASRLRGARRNVLYINECNNVSEDAYTQLAMRTDMDIYLDYNPSNRFWIENVLISPEAEKLTLTYKDNTALSQTVIDFLESKLELAKTSDYWTNWCNVYLRGLPGVLEGVIFNNWSEIDTIPEDARLIGYGIDFGYANDETTCTAVYKYNNDIIVDEIIYQKGLSNSDIANLLKDNNVIGELYCDSAEPKTIAELKKYGFSAYPTKKGPDSILHGISLMQEYQLLVTKKSINIKNELINYMWKKDKDGNSMNVPIDIFNHSIDGIRYLFLMKLGKKSINAGQFTAGKAELNPKNRITPTSTYRGVNVVNGSNPFFKHF